LDARNLGGLCGKTNAVRAINCYSTGTVTGGDNSSKIGGLCGENSGINMGGIIINSYFLDTAGPDNGWGTPLTKNQMKQQISFTGWDFVGETTNSTEDIWNICEGTNYPRFVWQISPADFVCPDGITLDDFYFFTDHLEDVNCDSSNGYCDGTDLDLSGTVDIYDLEIFVDYWLAEVQ